MSEATNSGGVGAVLVSWHPERSILTQSLDALVAQVDHVVVVDNGSAAPWLRDLCTAYPHLVFVGLDENRGLANALNAGIDRARAIAGVAQVLLMDQDSVPGPGMVGALRAALARQAVHGSVAAVGPCFRDGRESADAPFVRIGFPFNHKLRCDGSGRDIRCDFLITSGSLIPLAVLERVGGMDDGLFIDNVDLDWCFRATAAGYALYGVCGARLQHRLGEARRRIVGFPRAIVVHPPMRLYYMMRNRVWLYRRAHTPRRWIAQDLPRIAAKLLLFSLLVGPRIANLRAMLAGLRAGITHPRSGVP